MVGHHDHFRRQRSTIVFGAVGALTCDELEGSLGAASRIKLPSAIKPETLRNARGEASP